MNTTEKTEENATAQDFFKFLGALISLAFGALFFFLKLLGDSNNSGENEDPIAKEMRNFDDLTSTSTEALANPMNTYSETYDD